ncbi:MAG: ACP S-malonyltransferase [candidate division Zixibacteria bacterium]|nr:ACP S-malonyltransferase [candidate division Zixibacteria bacterium]MBU1469218.1 ACP S-malonyltransferase [candidate division Zixibacteria bacterium]MBU2624528.1 ACP S-malonyltransferase [candidate division Zixibacteria bacterium]
MLDKPRKLRMDKTAFVFPGQASQYVGMARDLHDASLDVRSLFESASRILDFDLAEACFDGPLEKLTRTEHTQPAVLVHSLAILTMIGDSLPVPAFCAGHSLGEYSAHACAGTLSFEDAIAAVRDRSRLMKSACDSTDGTMAAAIGGDDNSVSRMVKDASKHGILQPANYNSPGQIAMSGDAAGIQFAHEHHKEYGFKRMLPLKVGGAFHSPLMQFAADRMDGALAGLEFSTPECPVVANVTAEPVDSPESGRELLVKQITAPVKWMQSVQKMCDLGVTRFVEIGPGKVLTGLIKKIAPDVETANIDTLEDVELLLQESEVA